MADHPSTHGDSGREDEFPELVEPEISPRRSFLRAAGFTFAGGLLAGCSRAPVERAIPFLEKPEAITPGRAYFYASACAGCTAGCGILAKVRDGRPVKLEGNPEHPLSQGRLCAVGQASILGLYDSARLKHPLKQSKPASWEQADREISESLAQISRNRRGIYLVSNTITSPTLRRQIGRFLDRFPGSRHVVYDPLSSSAILDAHLETHGARLLPRYRFHKAEVIAGFDADFLGTWISPVEFAAGYRAGRSPDGPDARFSYHVQFESRLSLTGAKADKRVVIAPHELTAALAHLAAILSAKANHTVKLSGFGPAPVPDALLAGLAERLWEARGKSLVICGSQDVRTQVITNFLNHLLGNYGATIDLDLPSHQRQGADRDAEALLARLKDGRVDALFFHGVNPVYELPGWDAVAQTIQRIALTVSLSGTLDETAELAHYVCPDHHPLESWGDSEAVSGIVTLVQPAIRPLGKTRSVVESLGAWMGESQSTYDQLRACWKQDVFPRQSDVRSFEEFWEQSVQDGFAKVPPARRQVAAFRMAAVGNLAGAARARQQGAYSLALYPKLAMLDGRHAANPWLQELPDPISKITWDNYACLSPAAAAALNVKDGDVIQVEAGNGSGRAVEAPVLVQPGQHDRVVALALGYGRKVTERFARVGPEWLYGKSTVGPNGRVGVRVNHLLTFTEGALEYAGQPVSLRKTAGTRLLAATQSQHTIEEPSRLRAQGIQPRPILRETSFHQSRTGSNPSPAHEEEDLWPPDHRFSKHHWGMAVDLAACTGCSACVIACQVENNIPVVGKDEARRHREMHWIRLDRYYSEEGGFAVAYQPMMCQHCEHASCETVCPALATVHSEEGLNQQIYNRCVGTRYCANNCPYKVRRFNWFDYRREDRLQNMVLNPDIAVRSRGVMEKCSFCIQRIQEAKIEAKRRGVPVADGDIETACQQTCPSNAILFGDLNDPHSALSRLLKSPRRYRVLEELNERPSVHYLALVRNREET
ncbi:MAG: 4Fe-4S dicluster domain-containing protein [Acidobacteria bacterium]|nr:4Fe-4S dicluster domain-containing protein [Acidobacteriota bacterium]